MAPEQLHGDDVSRAERHLRRRRRAVGSAGGRTLFQADNPGELLNQLIWKEVPAPSTMASGISPLLDEIVLKGLDRDPVHRYATAREMAVRSNKMGGWSRPSKWAPGSKRRPARRSTGALQIVAEIKTTRPLPFRVGARLRPCGER